MLEGGEMRRTGDRFAVPVVESEAAVVVDETREVAEEEAVDRAVLVVPCRAVEVGGEVRRVVVGFSAVLEGLVRRRAGASAVGLIALRRAPVCDVVSGAVFTR